VKILLGDYEGAIADFNVALEQDPELAISLSNRGYTRYYLGELDDALLDFNAALSLDGDLTNALLNKASLLASMDQVLPALELLDGIIEESSEDATLYLNRGLIRELSGNLNGACEDWNRAKELGAEQAEVYLKECKNL
jgi:tetratricopeptide (TPR) repeat protein